jgi:hypothetical protein
MKIGNLCFVSLAVFTELHSVTEAKVSTLSFDPWYSLSGLLSGYDVPNLPPMILNVSTAESLCTSNINCFGYSFNSSIPNPNPSELLLFKFRSITFTAGESNWYSFVRCGVYSPCPPQPVCQKGTWESLGGFLAADGDVIPPDTSISLLDAKNKCISTINCLGITFSGTNEQPDGLIPMVYYKNQTDFSSSEGWWTWLQCLS